VSGEDLSLALAVGLEVAGLDRRSPRVGNRPVRWRMAAEQAIETRSGEQLLVASIAPQDAEVEMLVEGLNGGGEPPVLGCKVAR
jgi:hypothetical protein